MTARRMTDEIALCVCVCVCLSLSRHTLCDGVQRRSVLTFIVVFLVFLGGAFMVALMSVLNMLVLAEQDLRKRAPAVRVHRYDVNPNITSIKAVLLHHEVVPGRFLVEDMDNLSFQVCSCSICCPDSGTHSVVSSLRGTLTSDL